MMKSRGFSLTELMTVMVIIGLLASAAFLVLGGVWKRARIATCSANLHDVHGALWAYAAQHDNQFPPFAFSDTSGDLPRSGHWIGQSSPPDPADFGRVNMQNVNLGVLAAEKIMSSSKLNCPAFKKTRGVEGLFPATSRWSNYGLRFPTSPDLFLEAPGLANRGSPASLLGIFAQAGGGLRVSVGTGSLVVPLVKTTRLYRLDAGVAVGRTFVPWESALVSDVFWRLGAAAASSGGQSATLKNTWCHERSFNVLYGSGAVLTVDDDGTVADQTSTGDNHPPASDGQHYAKYAERIWQFFETAR